VGGGCVKAGTWDRRSRFSFDRLAGIAKMRREAGWMMVEEPSSMPEENEGSGDIVVCPTCQKIWPKGTKFCTQCGTWIESGEVMEPGPRPTPGGQPTVGPSPPGIGPKRPAVGPAPPGIGPAQPTPTPPSGGFGQRRLGSAPPSAGFTLPGAGPQAGGPGSTPPGGAAGPGDVPVAPVAAPEDIPAEEPAKKKYSFRVEPQRQEHIPTSATFVPKREEKKKKKSPVLQTLIVIVCLLAIAFAVISMAFKPLYHCILGTASDLIGKEDSAVKFYERASSKGSTYAKNALTKLGKKAFAKHLELQYYKDWSAESTITLKRANTETVYQSTISYTAPGKVTETITQNGSPKADHNINENGYSQRIGSTVQLSAEQYAAQMQSSIGMSPTSLFSKDGKDDVTKVLFDDLGMRLLTIQDQGDGKAYVFEVDLEGNPDRVRQLGMLQGPFVPWASVATWTQIGRVQYNIRVSDGFLLDASYYATDGQLAVQQTFTNLGSKGE
jgi:hypothetical protein